MFIEQMVSGKAVLPGSKFLPKLALKALAGEALSAGDICYLSSQGSAFPTAHKASAATIAQARTRLFVARAPAPAAGDPVELLPLTVIENCNTNGKTIGDPVYLGASGAISLTASGIRRKIGTVAKVGTTDGEVLFDGSPPSGGVVISGILAIAGAASGTVNSATLGGSFGGKAVVATANTNDAGKYVLHATWSSNDLVITMSASFTGNVAYMIFVE